MSLSTSSKVEDKDDRLEKGLYPSMVLDLPVDSSVEVSLDDYARGEDGDDENDCRISFIMTRDTDGNSDSGLLINDKEAQSQLHQKYLIPLVRTLMLLRQYEAKFGMPSQSEVTAKDQAFILREINQDLYAGGAPIWVLADVMAKAAEGLTGKSGIHFWILPRKTLIIDPSNSAGATSMFSTVRGFAMYKLNRMTPVAVRLASFASRSNHGSTKLPHPEELRKAISASSSTRECESCCDCQHDFSSERDELAAEILNSASNAPTWFSFLNREDLCSETSGRKLDPSDALLEVSASTRELFYQLVTMEAFASIKKIQGTPDVSYPMVVTAFFHMASAAGACAFWFNGSWQDMIVSAFLSLLVAVIKLPSLRLPERIALEVIASVLVGLVAGLIALRWPDDTCFGAMSLAGVLDILHGFKIVFAVMEIMSRHTVAGGADLLEGILFTGLIAYFLQTGQSLAVVIMGQPSGFENLACDQSISEWWFLLLVPLAATSWSGLFCPSSLSDLLVMGFHGTLGFATSWALSHAPFGNLPNFMASVTVTFSAGVFARWTGRHAVGNIVAGIFGLVPGAYLVRGLYSEDYTGFVESTVVRCIMIGIGSWTGILFCSPRFLGKRSLLCTCINKPKPSTPPKVGRREGSDKPFMLFF